MVESIAASPEVVRPQDTVESLELEIQELRVQKQQAVRNALAGRDHNRINKRRSNWS